ncbi:MAG TPA: hypothetical protein VGG91_19395 [Myxococcaceae bacterium]
MGLTGPLREIPAIDDDDSREALTELIGEIPGTDLQRPILVELCLDLFRSSDFAEVEATDEELAPELQAALADAPRTLDDLVEITLPSDALLEESVRRFLEWLRGGGPPSKGPGGSCPPPAVPV